MVPTLTITGKPMKTYNIPQGAEGLLIIQEENRNVEQQQWKTRKELTYTDTYVQVDPSRVETYSRAAYEEGSMAQKLANAGYYVFSAVENQSSAYMLAIKGIDIAIS